MNPLVSGCTGRAETSSILSASLAWDIYTRGFPKTGVPFLGVPIRDSILFGPYFGEIPIQLPDACRRPFMSQARWCRHSHAVHERRGPSEGYGLDPCL